LHGSQFLGGDGRSVVISEEVNFEVVDHGAWGRYQKKNKGEGGVKYRKSKQRLDK